MSVRVSATASAYDRSGSSTGRWRAQQPADAVERHGRASGVSPPASGSSKSSSASRSAGAMSARVGSPPRRGESAARAAAPSPAGRGRRPTASTRSRRGSTAALLRPDRVPRCRRSRSTACTSVPNVAPPGSSFIVDGTPAVTSAGACNGGSSGSSVFSSTSASLPTAGASCADAVNAEYDVRRQRVSSSRRKRAAARSPWGSRCGVHPTRDDRVGTHRLDGHRLRRFRRPRRQAVPRQPDPRGR